MIYPQKDTFMTLSQKYQRITVYREINGDMITPVILLQKFRDHKNLFLLESADIEKVFSRFSFFSVKPSHVITLNENTVHIDGIPIAEENPISFLKERFNSRDVYKDRNFGDFSGGHIGFFSYESVNHMDVLRSPLKNNDHFPDAVFFEINEFLVFDNHKFKLYAACSVEVGNNPEEDYKTALQRTAILELDIFQKIPVPEKTSNTHPLNLIKELSKESFIEKVNSIRTDIINGECIQVVLSNKYEVFDSIDAVSFYRSLRKINPSPYMFFMKFEDTVLCGSSPETHLKVSERQAILKPIAGTYPLSDNNDLEKLKKQILKDEKETAEHLMLLDLARNDLYTTCTPESVKVTKSFNVENYSHLIHIVSEVTGTLNADSSALELFTRTFPAGTVSGAPKVRAMELIDHYEPSPRGFYAGCVGYFDYDGSLDTCITIRSALINDEKTILRAGAGIVYDSNPESEFLEVERKLEALFKALNNSQNMEVAHVSVG